MLLVIDVGNTNTVFGVYAANKLLHHFRIETARQKTADEYGILFQQLLRSRNIDPAALDQAIIASVVPTLTQTFERVCQHYCGGQALVVGPGIKTGMPILYDNPKEVGADRIVNAVAAFERVKGACIVVDLGTATTFDAISKKGEYLGGAIVPGVGISMEALFQRASKLPRVELARPKSVIGKNTTHAMQAGMVYGYAGLVQAVVKRMKDEMGPARVIATGGLAALLFSSSGHPRPDHPNPDEPDIVDEIDEMLTLDGLALIHARQ